MGWFPIVAAVGSLESSTSPPSLLPVPMSCLSDLLQCFSPNLMLWTAPPPGTRVPWISAVVLLGTPALRPLPALGALGVLL